jgi:hypothetical protein
MEIEKIDINHTDWDSILSLSTVATGKKEPKNIEALKRRLSKEGTDYSPNSSPYRFVPIVVGAKDLAQLDKEIQRMNEELKNKDFEEFMFNHFFVNGWRKNGAFLTNLQNIKNLPTKLNSVFDEWRIAGIDDDMSFIEEVISGKNLTESELDLYSLYEIYRGFAPKFVYDHLRTHRTIDWLAQSNRHSLGGDDYYLPKGLYEKLERYENPTKHLLSLSQEAFSEALYLFGYKKEIYNRSMMDFKYREFIFGGWDIEMVSFDHLINLRGHGKGIQPETKEFALLFEKAYIEG